MRTDIIAERKAKYGNNFPTLAKLWNNYMTNCMSDAFLNESDVAFLLALLKVSRLAQAPEDQDTLEDLENYIWIATNYKEYAAL